MIEYCQGENMLIIMSGPSGSGKNAVINALLKEFNNIEIMKSCTTRKKRKGTKDDNYFYLSQKEFEERNNNGDFFETEMVHKGLWYGVLNESLENVIKGDKIYIKDIDVNGTQKIADYLVGKARVVKVFLDAPDDVLVDRLQKRGEDDESIITRQSRFAYERSFKDKYDLVVNNIVFDTTVKIIKKYIEERKLAQI